MREEMDIKETLRLLLQEMVLPDLGRIKEENGRILAILDHTGKRLDDVNLHLADQSRSIDELRSEMTRRMDRDRSELNQLIIDVRTKLGRKIETVHSDMVLRLDANYERIDRFFETSVTQKELAVFEDRIKRLEGDYESLKQRVA